MSHVVSTFHILLVADPVGTARVSAILAPFGYRLHVVRDAYEAVQSIAEDPPEVVIISDALPGLEGFSLLRTLRTSRGTEELPVMFLASGAEQEARAFQLGAEDVCGERTSDVALRARVRVLLRMAAYRRRLGNEKRRLELRVADRTRELFEITIATVAALEKAAEMSDQETGQHMIRVASYSACLAEHMNIGSELIEKIRLYAPLHDVGKVGVRHEILKKEGILTAAEFEEMKQHTLFGHELLTAARADQVARNIALSHHERVDGSGYPHGLSGDGIPIEARIVAAADVFDALTTRRRYKDAMSPDDAMRTITVELAGRFDPAVSHALTARYADILDILQSYS
ncbi:MAG TPA: HD domain-containing protein [Myxococcota bacterium]|jgi:putative two-component system response regulator|nr:HD domain-containing protein [Myxococcota bacterium]